MMDAVSVEGVWKYFGDFPALRDVTYEPAGDRALLSLAAMARVKRRCYGFLPVCQARRKDGFRFSAAARANNRRGGRSGIWDTGSGFTTIIGVRKSAAFREAVWRRRCVWRAKTWLDRVGLGHVYEGLPREFSRGMRQRLAVARAFLTSRTS